jgi:hypothetical protein
MKRPWLILWMFCSIPAALAEETSTVIVTSPEVQEILDRWQLQAQSKHSAARRWEIVRHAKAGQRILVMELLRTRLRFSSV